MPVLSPAVARSSSTVLLLLLGSLFLSLRQRLARITRCSHPFRLAHRWWCSLFSRLAPTARCSCIRWLAPSLRCSLLLRLAPTTVVHFSCSSARSTPHGAFWFSGSLLRQGALSRIGSLALLGALKNRGSLQRLGTLLRFGSLLSGFCKITNGPLLTGRRDFPPTENFSSISSRSVGYLLDSFSPEATSHSLDAI